MAQPIQLDPIKYLNGLTQFNGNKNDLNTFIKLIDRIQPLLTTYDELSQLVFSDIIKSRTVGKAKEVLEINAHVRSWQEIKTVLENNFGEKKTCEELFDDLRSVTFNSNTIEFYNEIKYRLKLLNNKAAMVVGEGEGLNQVALNNQRSALHIFKGKMPEPMRTILACRNPSTLESAMDILFECGYDRMGRDGHIVKTQKPNRNDKQQNNGNNSRNYNQTNNQTNFSNRPNQNQRQYYNQQNRNQGQSHNQGNNNSGNYDNRYNQRQFNNGQNFSSGYSNQQNVGNQNRQIQRQNINGQASNPPHSDRQNSYHRQYSNNPNNQQYPEPMEVNTAENFHPPALQGNYPI